MTGADGLERGARVRPDGSTRFSVWAPAASEVRVHIHGADGPREQALEKGRDGVFEAVVPGVSAGADYAFRLEGGPGRPDPVSRHQPRGVHGPSRVVDETAFAWTDGGWRGIEPADLILYELHVGTFTPEGTFEGLIGELPALRDLGVTAIELMPVAEFPGARNWGYDGVHLYAPQSTYGGPEGLRRLVDAAHAAGLGVVLDVVYNHLGPEGNYLREFGPYFTDRYRVPWGDAMNFDGPGSDEVRRHVVDNALHWIGEYHVDGLRLDAVHGIFDFSARHILEEIADAVHALGRHLGRRTLVVAESDLNDARLVRPLSRGGYALDAIWNDDFHHAVHVALTGERAGYYADFEGVPDIAKALRDRFVLDGRFSRFRGRRHGAPCGDVPADRIVVFVQNHDQVGNRARGDRLAALVPPEEVRLAAALLLLSPYVPLLFMGEEVGETRPFLYFVSHTDPELVEAVRRGRREEFRSFGWTGEIPDPQSVETFERSRPDRRSEEPGRAGIAALYRDLIRLRREIPLLRPGASAVDVQGGDDGWIALARTGGGDGLLTVWNFSDKRREMALALPGAGDFRLLLRTDAPRYGGSAEEEVFLEPGFGGGARVEIGPRMAAVFRRVS